jgi:hypothetical protein
VYSQCVTEIQQQQTMHTYILLLLTIYRLTNWVPIHVFTIWEREREKNSSFKKNLTWICIKFWLFVTIRECRPLPRRLTRQHWIELDILRINLFIYKLVFVLSSWCYSASHNCASRRSIRMYSWCQCRYVADEMYKRI